MSKGLFKSGAVYVLSNILGASVPFLFLPFMTAYLSKGEYGYYTLFLVIYFLFRPIQGVSAVGSFNRLYFDPGRDKTLLIRSFHGYLFQSFIGWSGVVFLLWMVFGELFYFSLPWLLSIVLMSYIRNVCELHFGIWRILNKPFLFGSFKVSLVVAEVLLAVLLILFVHSSWENRVLAHIISWGCVYALIMFFAIKRGIVFGKISKEYIVDAFRFGLPYIPHTIGGVLITYSDRVFVQYYFGETELGVFSVGAQIGMVIYLIQNSMNQAWVPWFYSKMLDNRKESLKAIRKNSYLIATGLVCAFIGLYFFKRPIFEWFIAEDYREGLKYMPWIAGAYLMNGFYKLFVNYLLFDKRSGLVAAITISVALFNILLNYLLIREMGSIGAAVATFIAFGTQFIIVAIFAMNRRGGVALGKLNKEG